MGLIMMIEEVMILLWLAAYLDLYFLASAMIGRKRSDVMHRRANQRLRVQMAQLVEHLLFSVDLLEIFVIGATLSKLVLEEVPFLRFFLMIIV